MIQFPARRVQPDKLAIARGRLAIHQRIVRDGKVSDISRVVILNRLRNWKGFALEAKSAGIENLRRQSPVFHVEQVAVAVGDVRSDRQNLPGLAALERAGINASHRVIARALNKEEVLPVGKKIGIAIGELAVVLVLRSGGLRRPASIGNAIEWAGNSRGKENNALVVPGAAAAIRSVAQRLHRPARGFNFSQLAGGEEAQVFRVWRPEGKHSSFRSRQQRGFAGT